MASRSFTFVNTTGTPKIDECTAKRVRGHVTSLNFASKRRRRAERLLQQTQCRAVVPARRQYEMPRSELQLVVAISTAIGEADSQTAATLRERFVHGDDPRLTGAVNEFWGLIFADDRHDPQNQTTRAWLRMLASERSLVEATMAVAMRCWMNSGQCQVQADVHSYKALALLTQRAADQLVSSDGFLGAVCTMCVTERFLNNTAAWRVHIDGLVQTVRERRLRGLDGLPALLRDLLILDMANDVFDSTRIYRRQIVDEMGEGRGGILSTLAAATDDIQVLAKERRGGTHHSQDIEKIRVRVQLCRRHQSPWVRATGLTLELLLLLFTRSTEQGTIWRATDDLRAEMETFTGPSCFMVDLTSCQLIIGVSMSKDGSKTQWWFLSKLRKAVQAVRLRGAENAFAVLLRTVSVDPDATARLEKLRILIDPSSALEER